MAFDALVMLANYRRLSMEENLRALECYKLVLRVLVQRGSVGRAVMVLLGDQDHAEEQDGVTVQVTSSFRTLPKTLLEGDLLLVRADRRAYLPALARGRWHTRLFYPASATFFPRRTSGYDVLLTDEPTHATLLSRHFPNAVCRTWIKTADPARFHPTDDAPAFDVCCFGHMDAFPKNYAALPAIVAARPDLRYVIIGRPHSPLVAELDRTGADVHYAGSVDHSAANTLLNRSRVALVLSRRDGSPRTLLETMAAGVPQIVNAELHAGTRYVVEGAGFVVPVSAFPETIDRVVGAPPTSEPARIFREQFGPDQAADALFAAARAGYERRRQRGRLLQCIMHTSLGSWLNSRRHARLLREARAGTPG